MRIIVLQVYAPSRVAWVMSRTAHARCRLAEAVAEVRTCHRASDAGLLLAYRRQAVEAAEYARFTTRVKLTRRYRRLT